MSGYRRFLAVLLTLCMMVGIVAIPAAAAEFDDLPPAGSWSYDGLQAAVEQGLLEGVGGKLLPKGVLTRAQLAAMVNRAFGAQAKADLKSFSDVPADAWYYEDMAKAVGMKTFGGDGGGQLAPQSPVTREAAFTVLARAMKLTPGQANALTAFSDYAQVSGWAKDGLAALIEGGYIEGAGGKLSPQATITREEFAQVMHRLLGTYLRKAGTYTQVAAGNVMINAPEITLKGVTVTGDLIIGEGVGDGTITLDAVNVQGRVVVRGGGEHSIRIVNKSSVGSVVLGKTAQGGVRILSERGCRVEVVEIDDGKDDVILEGSFQNVTVDSKTAVVLKDATVTTLTMSAPESTVVLEGKSSVTTAKVEAGAEGTTLTVAKEAQIAKVDSAAPKTEISGAGKVTEATVSGNDTKINTAGTTVTVDKDTTGVTAGDKNLTGGDKVTTKPETSVPGGGNTGPTYETRTVTTEKELVDAIVNIPNISNIIVDADIALNGWLATEKSITVNPNRTLTINQYFCIIKGTILNKGTIQVNGDLEVDAPGVLKNEGTITVREKSEGVEPGRLDLFDAYTPNLISAAVVGTPPVGPTFYGAQVQSEAALRTAMAMTEKHYTMFSIIPEKDSMTVRLEADLVIAGDTELIVHMGVTLVVPNGRTLTIEKNAELRIQGTVDVREGTAVNNGHYTLTTVGTLKGSIGGEHTSNYVVDTAEEWTQALADNACRYLEVNGSFTLPATTAVNSNLTISAGTLTVPSGSTLTLNRWTELRKGASITVEDGGTLVIGGDPAGLIVGGTVNNAGTVTLNNYMQVNGKLNNSGSVTIAPESGNLELNGGVLENNGAVTKNGRLALTNGTITGTKIDGLDVADLYDDTARAPSSFPADTRCENYGARVVNGAGLEKIMADKTHPYQYVCLENDVVLDRNVTITRNLDINSGRTLTVPAQKNLTIGAAEPARIGVGTDGRLVIQAGGTLINHRELWVERYAESNENETGGLVENAGTILNQRAGDGEYTKIGIMAGGTLRNTGTLTNGVELTVDGGTLNTTGGTFSNSGEFILTGNAALTMAESQKISNGGYIAAIDVYSAEGEKTTVTIPAERFQNISDGRYERVAQVSSGAGLTAALASSNPAYDVVAVRGTIDTWDGTIGSGQRVRVESYWAEEEQFSRLTFGTATIGGALEISGRCAATVAGVVTLERDAAVDVYGTLEKGEGGSFTGEGRVTVICSLNGAGAPAENQPTVSEGFGKWVSLHAIVTSEKDFDAAIDPQSPYTVIRLQADESGNPAQIELTKNCSTAKEIYVFEGNQLTVAGSVTLTLEEGSFYQNFGGTTQIYGALIVSSGAFFGNHGGENQVSSNTIVGDNAAAATFTNNGTVENNAVITVMKNSKLDGSGNLQGSGTIQNNGGFVDWSNASKE